MVTVLALASCVAIGPLIIQHLSNLVENLARRGSQVNKSPNVENIRRYISLDFFPPEIEQRNRDRTFTEVKKRSKTYAQWIEHDGTRSDMIQGCVVIAQTLCQHLGIGYSSQPPSTVSMSS